MDKFLTFNHMKYITLFLIILVLVSFLYSQSSTPRQTTSTLIPSLKSFSTPSSKEIPIYCVNTNKPQLSLTFDSAWGTEDLDEILDILEKHDAKATFFVTGEWAQKNPEAIIKIFSKGHELGNHGMHHLHMPALTKEQITSEIQECDTILFNLTNKKPSLFRAPYSDWNDLVVQTARQLNYHSINQSVDSLDWKDYGAAAIVDTVCQHKNLENGSILLLHNGTLYTKDALDELLTQLEIKGYNFVLVSDLIYKDHYFLDHTGKQFPSKH